MLPELLQSAVIPPPVIDVLQRLRARGHEAYLVGGGVRDLLRGAAPKDFDVATKALPQDVQRAFPRVIPTGIQHGTVTVMSRGVAIEVTTFRSEGVYVDGRRPSEVSFDASIEQDLARRDFTINAMAFDPLDRRLVDPYQGQADLADRRVRCVGEALARFTEDGLRPLRAIRFCSVLGFDLDPLTLQAIPATVHVFRKVARERIREELMRILLSSRARQGLTLLRDTGLLAACLPELAALPEPAFDETLLAVERAEPDAVQRLSSLLQALVRPDLDSALDRLALPVKLSAQVRLLVEQQDLTKVRAAAGGELRRWMAAVGEANVPLLLAHALALGQELASLPARVTQELAAKPALTARALALDGQAIMRVLGIPPSPQVGNATRFLLDHVLDDPALNEPDLLAELLRQWAAQNDG